jgi:flagellar hook-associated protein 2
MGISSVGLGSGVLTSDLIDKLAGAERAPTEARLERKEADVNAELSVFGLIQSAITELRLPARTLSNPDLFESKTVTSGNSAFSGVVDSSTASTGSYQLEVTALAVSQTLTTRVLLNDSDTTAMGTGSLSITVGTTTANISIDSSNNTLDGIAAAINDESSLGVTASVINTGSGYKLVLNSDETGIANEIDIVVTDTGDGSGTDENGLSRLSYTAGATNLDVSQPAVDAAFEFNGVPITRSSNTVDDVISGVTISLTGTNAGSPSSLVIANDTTEVVDKVKEFIEKFNALQTLINDNSEFDPSGATENGVLLGDATTRTMMAQVRRVLGAGVQGLESANVRGLAEVGISTDYKTGLLAFNETTFTQKLASDPKDVAALFGEQGRVSDSQVQFETSGINTKPGTYAINITTAAARGELSGNVSLAAGTTIDANNDNFTLMIDGITSDEITLDVGSYTQEELVIELQTKINQDSALAAAGNTVTVSLDGSNQIVINSNKYGSSSKVELLAVDTNTVAQLGLSVGVGTDGVDVEGTINGVAATGSGQVLTAATGDDSEGIRVTVDGTATGDRGTVTYIEGIGEQFVDLITRFVTTGGALAATTDRLNSQLLLIAEERVDLNTRIESLTARLARQFTAADIIISQLNSTADFVKQQLDALAGVGSDK